MRRMSSFVVKIGLAAALIVVAAVPGASTASAQAGKSEQTFKDWKMVCSDVAIRTQSGQETGETRPVCYIFRALRNAQAVDMVVAVGVRYMGSGRKPFLLFQLPPDADREFGLRFAVDDGVALQGLMRGCDADRCLVVGQLTDDLLTTMRAGEKLRLIFRVGEDPLRFDVSLLGFTRANAALAASGR